MAVKKQLLSIILSVMMVFALMPSGAYTVFAQDPEGSQYKTYFGTVEEYSTFSSGSILKDSYYFDDSWFAGSEASERNDALALISMQLTASAIENDEDKRCEGFLRDLDFDRITSKSLGADDDGMGYTCGIKKIGDDTLAAIVVHSSSLDSASKESAWLQNFTINGDGITSGRQYSYEKASQQFDISKLENEMKDFAGDENTHLKYWVMGQSRGGAIANLLAVRLRDYLEPAAGDVYAYTFEVPANVDRITEDRDYGFIHNYQCDDDLITMVPPWGMERYGRIHDLNAILKEKGFNNDSINAELKKLGSKAEIAAEASDEQDQIKPADIIQKLESKIKTRAEYSETKEDTFTPVGGGDAITVEYDYQTVFRDLMGAIFGEQGLKLDGLAARLSEVVSCLGPFLQGYLIEIGELDAPGFAGTSDPNAFYWDSAQQLCEFLDSMDSETGNLPLSEQDVYAILKLAGPIAIDPDKIDEMGFDVTSETVGPEVVMISLAPVISILADKDSLLMSHHFDTLIAKMKLLAPAPDMDDIAVEIPQPAAGETTAKTPGKFAAAVEALGYPWLLASAKWDTADKTLGKGKVYYLDAEFEVAGHSVPGDLKLTINGEEPIAAPEVTCVNGINIAKVTWKFTLGSPKEYTISFDDVPHGTTPEPMTAYAGEKLKNIGLPAMESVQEEDGYFRFDGWFDANDDPAEEIAVNGDMKLFSGWTRILDTINISFDSPQVGDKAWKMPASEDDYLYYLRDIQLRDSDGNDVAGSVPEGPLELSFKVYPIDGTDFALEPTEFDPESLDYVGKVMVGGKDADFYYDNEGCLSVTYKFDPKKSGSDPSGQAALSITSAKLKAGDTMTLKVKNSKVSKWSSSNKKAVSVSKGKVTALKKGKATITVTLVSGKKLKCTVNVTSSPTLSKKSIVVKKGKTKTVKITGKAAAVKNKYKNTKKAKVKSNAKASKLKIKGLKKGKSTIKIRVNGKWLKLKVKVK